MIKFNPQVENYFIEGCGRCSKGGTPECKVNFWKPELQHLRMIILDCGLTEESKWGVPCYTYNKKNILILAAFKDYSAISFFKGSLLKDTAQILLKPGDQTQAARLIKFTQVTDITSIENHIKNYIAEAIEIEEKGLKVNFKKADEYSIPEEFQKVLNENSEVKSAFYKLTPGRQRAYLIHFSAPKQSKTRESRIEKCLPQILDGKGLNE